MMMMDKQQQQQQQLAVRQCDMEVMKMAMLKQEETFRHQVHELHRLYRVQRQLMSDLGRGGEPVASARRRRKQPRRALNLQLPADEYIVSTDEEADDEAELELTLALGTTTARRQSSRQGGHNSGSGGGGSSPFASDCSGASLPSSPPSAAEYYSDDGPAVVHAPPPPCQRTTMAFDLGEGMMTRQQQAPWLMQCQYLSLRMT